MYCIERILDNDVLYPDEESESSSGSEEEENDAASDQDPELLAHPAGAIGRLVSTENAL